MALLLGRTERRKRMRINDYLVIQLVDAVNPEDDLLVFVDDSTGAELVIARSDWPKLMYALGYLMAPALVAGMSLDLPAPGADKYVPDADDEDRAWMNSIADHPPMTPERGN
jgi:hypothetical protein